MIGLDTNVLIRHLVGDDPAQAARVDRLLDARCSAAQPAFVNRIVLCETAWTLERTYGYGRTDIARVLEALLLAREVLVEDRDCVAAALRTYGGNAIGFSDALIAEINVANGCEATATFDRKAAKIKGFMPVA
ncbi:MAG TPA: type II toxin-antitoxin system VapC family toxin [Rhizomicrobium sp.]